MPRGRRNSALAPAPCGVGLMLMLRSARSGVPWRAPAAALDTVGAVQSGNEDLQQGSLE